jgi:ABC-type amino acid transport substrate-binding protein
VGNSHLSRLSLRRRVTAVAVSVIFVWVGAGAPAGGRPLDTVRQAGALRVTVYSDYKPYSWIEDGRSRGIDVEIAEALAKAVGVKLELFNLRADDNLDDDLRNGVWKGTVFGAAPGDLVMHVPYDKRIETKNDRVVLAAPYHVDGLALAVDPPKASQARDLSLFLQEKVAVDVGSLGDLILISAYDKRLLPDIVHVRGTERAAEAFERREVSAFYGETSAVQALAKVGQRPFALLYPETNRHADWAIGIAVRSDSRDLGIFVDDVMQKLETSGEVQGIFAHYGVDWRKPAVMQ